MAKVRALEKMELISELTQGMECVNQLKNQIFPLDSPEECDLLLRKILSSLDKSLSILNLKTILGIGKNPSSSSSSCSSVVSVPGDGIFESHVSFLGNNSPKSEVSDLDSSRDQAKNMVFKKRKTMQQWSKQISISGTGVESPYEDGYSWRKYGQKDILGANHPRAYYRCTHRKTQGCLATKQVQRSEEAASIFEITYKGRHSCKVAQSAIISIQNENRNQNQNRNQKQNKNQYQLQKQELGNQKQVQEMVCNYEPNHKVETLNITEEEQAFTSFTFPPTTLKSEISETQFFSNAIAPFSSPATSESTYLSFLATQDEEFGMDRILQSSESDLTELMSTPTSITNSPFGGEWDFSVDYEPNLTFDIAEFFS